MNSFELIYMFSQFAFSVLLDFKNYCDVFYEGAFRYL